MTSGGKPTSGHSARFRNAAKASAGDALLSSPVFQRNAPPIIAALSPWLSGHGGNVLEIGAGTGQHAAAFALAFPHLAWWPSDPDEIHCASIAAWQSELRAPKRSPLQLDASSDWASREDVQAITPLAAVISLNVIHISPFAVAEGIVAGAGKALGAGGLLIFYGPFRENGRHIGTGNESFDQGLRADNPEWGVRDTADIGALAADAGLEFASLTAMPANNRLLIFRKSGD